MTSYKRQMLVAAASLAAVVAAVPAAADVKKGVDLWQDGKYADAVAEWRRLAEKGDADARFNMGQAYKLGRGVPADLKIAQTWYEKAGAQGHEQAQANLGLILFQNGQRKQAMQWIEKAAKRGDPRAQYVLATALFNGDVVGKDWPRAYALMTRASTQGLPMATSSLAQMEQHIPLPERQKGLELAKALETGAAAPGEKTGKPDKVVLAQATPKAAPALKAAPEPKQTLKPASPPVAGKGKQWPMPTVSTWSGMTAKPGADPSPVLPTPAKETPGAKSAAAAAQAKKMQEPKTAEAAPKKAASAAPASAGGGWRVQLGAYPSEAAAKAEWARLSKRISALGGLQPSYEKYQAFTRLRVGPVGGKADANKLCAAAKAAGQGCFPVAP